MTQNRFILSYVVKRLLKCVNLLIMRFDGSVSEILLGDFRQKMADSTAISCQTISIMILDQFSHVERCTLTRHI